MLSEVWLIFLFGGAGCLSRYFIGGAVHRILRYPFPFGTLTVNVVGSFFLPMFMEIALNLLPIDPRLRTGIAVGFFGGLTTFSSFSYESVKLLEEGSLYLFLLNLLSNVMLCLTAAIAGIYLARRIIY